MKNKEPNFIRGKYTNGQKEATMKYLKNKYDELRGIRVVKGQKEVIRAHAATKGMSLSAYVLGLITKDMEQEKTEE